MEPGPHLRACVWTLCSPISEGKLAEITTIWLLASRAYWKHQLILVTSATDITFVRILEIISYLSLSYGSNVRGFYLRVTGAVLLLINGR